MGGDTLNTQPPSKRHRRRRRHRLKINYTRLMLSMSILIILIVSILLAIFNHVENSNLSIASKNPSTDLNTPTEAIITPQTDPPKKEKQIVISAAGDCILGRDDKLNYSTSLPAMWKAQNNDYSYFLSNVKPIFSQDDYTIVNLENPLTDSQNKVDKGEGIVFHFKGPQDFINILTSSSVEGVTIANNHIYDYGEEGFNDTIKTLESANIDYCGEGNIIIKEINEIKIGFLGYKGWTSSNSVKEKIKNDITTLKTQGVKIIIPYFHWGIEKQYEPCDTQVDLAHFAIDMGADLVLGSHPHVIQSLENYKGKLISYSFGNFSFGGNSNPNDKRTFILQVKFNFSNDSLQDYEVKIIPTFISSVQHKNDYRPTPMDDDNKTKFLKTINELSPTLNNKVIDDFFKLDPVTNK